MKREHADEEKKTTVKREIAKAEARVQVAIVPPPPPPPAPQTADARSTAVGRFCETLAGSRSSSGTVWPGKCGSSNGSDFAGSTPDVHREVGGSGMALKGLQRSMACLDIGARCGGVEV